MVQRTNIFWYDNLKHLHQFCLIHSDSKHILNYILAVLYTPVCLRYLQKVQQADWNLYKLVDRYFHQYLYNDIFSCQPMFRMRHEYIKQYIYMNILLINYWFWYIFFQKCLVLAYFLSNYEQIKTFLEILKILEMLVNILENVFVCG